jgi:GT2 family glycosyltransferase
LRSLDCIQQAVKVAADRKKQIILSVLYGDASKEPLLADSAVKEIAEKYKNEFSFSYQFFNKNTGTAQGHNRLAAASSSDFIMIMNPDIVVSPRIFLQLLIPFDNNSLKTGIAEARQTPIEHQKSYDIHTGKTSWASTACVLIRRKAFEQVGGFDEKSFFMYCDDVDFSWMVRLLGYDVIYCPDAVVFHDKKLSASGHWIATSAEKYYSAEAALFMAHKWSYPEYLNTLLETFSQSADEDYQRAVSSFLEKKSEGRLPSQVDPKHTVALITAQGYGEYRFSL